MTSHSSRGLLAASVCIFALLSGAHASAAEAAASTNTVAGNGSEGTDVSELIVTAERNRAAADRADQGFGG